uniref:Uncharacterized protein n=1 Tax=viral metagenome TaxID=1070528 RepID=A0A6C0B7J1_9ZZZZ
MKTKYIYILLFFFALSLFCLYFVKSIEANSESNPPIHLGNYICRYFYNLGKSIHEKKDFEFDVPDSIDFVKNLPKKINYKKEFDSIRNEMIAEGIDDQWFIHSQPNDYGAFEMKDVKTEKFWLALKPLAHKIMDESFKVSNIVKTVDNPVIHFRCADVPFSKHPGYLFQKYTFFKDALTEITKRTKKHDKIILSYCNTHRSGQIERESCDIYAKSIKEYIETLDYKVDVQCNEYIDDFAIMFYAPAVISSGSSFSFMAGFFGKGVFISAGHQFYESPEQNNYLNDIGDWLFKGYNISHSSVADYTDTGSVIKLLSEE